MESSKVISTILSLYSKWGASDYIGESITQIEHALQCAQQATQDTRLLGYDNFIRNCVIVAALLHDIGHLIGLEHGDMEMRISSGIGIRGRACDECDSCDECIELKTNAKSVSLGIVGHEGIGAAYLKTLGMPRLVCDLVAGHVPAKRYLCTTRAGYYDALSDASKQTMLLQGGMMKDYELREFQSSVMPELKVFLREYDDKAKKTELNLAGLGSGMLEYKTHLETALLHGKYFV
jgi:predicted HD phosphohydrolase